MLNSLRLQLEHTFRQRWTMLGKPFSPFPKFQLAPTQTMLQKPEKISEDLTNKNASKVGSPTKNWYIFNPTVPSLLTFSLPSSPSRPSQPSHLLCPCQAVNVGDLWTHSFCCHSYWTPKHTPLKTNMTLETPPFSMGNASSNGGFFIVVLVFGG